MNREVLVIGVAMLLTAGVAQAQWGPMPMPAPGWGPYPYPQAYPAYSAYPAYPQQSYYPPTYAPPSYPAPAYAPPQGYGAQPASACGVEPCVQPAFCTAQSNCLPLPPPPPAPPPTCAASGPRWEPRVSMRNDCAPNTECAWISGEYLRWWAKAGPLNAPLVTTGSTADTHAGALGQPHTSVLFGQLSSAPANGFRLTAGGWFEPDASCGYEASGFDLLNLTQTSTFASNKKGSPLLAVPLTLSGVPRAVIIADPGKTPGSIAVTSASQLWGADFNLLFNMGRTPCLRIDALAGFRYAGLRESLAMTALQTSTTTGAVTDQATDSYRTSNEFFGGQLGLKASYQTGPFFAVGVLKAAVGVNHQTVNVNGTFTDFVTGAAFGGESAPNGILTTPHNVGQQTRNPLSVLPQAQFKIGWEFLSHYRIFAGYDLLYWSDVVRPGSQVNPNQQTGTSPANFLTGGNASSVFNHSNYYVQGFSGGLEIVW